jgi:large subunit ribosomal protein L29
MKAREIRQMSKDELIHRIADDEENLATMRFQLATSQLTDTSQLRKVRKDIARMKTIISEWEHQGEKK